MTAPDTSHDRIAVLRHRLQQLKTLHEDGTLGTDAYSSAKAPLERELLDHVMAQPAATAATAATAASPEPSGPVPRPSKNLLGGLAASVLALAVGGYMGFGSPGMPSAGPPGSAPAAAVAAAPEMTEAQFVAAVEQLATRLAQEPGNGEGWTLLARSYVRMGRHADAVPAFAKAVAIVGDDPRLLVDYADALAMKNERVLEGEPLALVERALKADPDNAKALALAGTAAFNRRDFKTAVLRWERLAEVSPPESPFLAQLKSSIDEARSLGGLPPAPRPAQAAQATQAARALPATAGAAASAAGAGTARAAATLTAAALTGTVRLAPALAAQARPDDVVFIFARPAEGGRMPLAILRHQVKDLPLSFRLDDSMAMSPAMKLSQFASVVVSARVSKSGQAAPGPGDLSGQTAAVSHQSQGLVIEINEVVKN